VAGPAVTGRLRYDRGGVLERVAGADGPAVHVLRVGLQGHGSQRKRCRHQGHRDFSHKPSSVLIGIAELKKAATTYPIRNYEKSRTAKKQSRASYLITIVAIERRDRIRMLLANWP
jgi:hypothetical protein